MIVMPRNTPCRDRSQHIKELLPSDDQRRENLLQHVAVVFHEQPEILPNLVTDKIDFRTFVNGAVVDGFIWHLQPDNFLKQKHMALVERVRPELAVLHLRQRAVRIGIQL